VKKQRDEVTKQHCRHAGVPRI